METNPYQAPEHCAEQPEPAWLATSTRTKFFAAFMAILGLAQLAEGSRLGVMALIGCGLLFLMVGAVAWVAGDHPISAST
jgi:hypothetical protein